MQFKRVTIPAVDPLSVGNWYRSRLAPDTDRARNGPAVRLGETTLRFTDPDTNPPAHLALRLLLDGEEIVDWLVERATILPVDGEPSRRFELLDPPALVKWFETTVGLSVWGTPSDTFAWVGDRHARFVVIPTGREWYPTNRAADLAPISVIVVDKSTDPGRHIHPTLPYEIVVD